jgi:L-ascorbate metabolism protein UlaG (beta-lactamase superfamily)
VSSTTRLLLDSTGPADTKRGSILFVGNATTLIRYAGFTILTDPNFLHRGEHARLGYGLRSRRLTDPALDVEQLPPLDLVLRSHLHGDHWDHVAEAGLDRALPIVTTPAAAEALAGRRFQSPLALSTWQTLAVTKGEVLLRVTAMPGRHGPRLLSRLLPDVMGTMLEFERRPAGLLLRLYITGDTLVHDGLGEIRSRYEAIDIALLQMGGMRVLGGLVTMDADQGVEMLRLVEPGVAIPIHFDDYTVFKSPLRDFQVKARRAGFEPRLRYLERGQRYTFEIPGARRQLARPA